MSGARSVHFRAPPVAAEAAPWDIMHTAATPMFCSSTSSPKIADMTSAPLMACVAARQGRARRQAFFICGSAEDRNPTCSHYWRSINGHACLTNFFCAPRTHSHTPMEDLFEVSNQLYLGNYQGEAAHHTRRPRAMSGPPEARLVAHTNSCTPQPLSSPIPRPSPQAPSTPRPT